MTRRSREAKARRRKAGMPKRGAAPKLRRRSSPTAIQETGLARRTRERDEALMETVAERTFYGSPALQPAVGIDPADTRALRKPTKNKLYQELIEKRIAELKSQIPLGGLREAVIRALVYINLGRGSVDERGFETVRRLRDRYGDMPLSEFKTLVRDQFAMLLIDEKAALAALPSLLPADAAIRSEGFNAIRQVMTACGETSAEDEKRSSEISRLFGIAEDGAAIPFPQNRRRASAKASGEGNMS